MKKLWKGIFLATLLGGQVFAQDVMSTKDVDEGWGTIVETGKQCGFYTSTDGTYNIDFWQGGRGHHRTASPDKVTRRKGMTLCKTGMMEITPTYEVHRLVETKLEGNSCWPFCFTNLDYYGVKLRIEFSDDDRRKPVRFFYEATEELPTQGKACRHIKREKIVTKLTCVLEQLN